MIILIPLFKLKIYSKQTLLDEIILLITEKNFIMKLRILFKELVFIIII